MNKTAAIAVSSLAGIAAIAAIAVATPSRSAVEGLASTAQTATLNLRTYKVDKVHTSVIFGIRHQGVTNFYGRFNEIDGEFSFDPENPGAGSFNFTIATNSVDTGNSDRDRHLRQADFFNSRQFPQITFRSTEVRRSGDKFELVGDLSLHGVTKRITAEMDWIGTGSIRGTPAAGFETRFRIKRSEFGMTTYLAADGGEGGGLGNTVNLIVAVEGLAN